MSTWSDTPAIPTARAARTMGAAHGLDGEALALYVRAGAEKRHAARTRAAKEAAMATAQQAHEPSDLQEAVLLEAWALCTLEIGGIGGALGIAGDATARMPWAAGLGKGRKHASDGMAWDAAITEAQQSIAQDLLTMHPDAREPFLFAGIDVTGACLMAALRMPDESLAYETMVFLACPPVMRLHPEGAWIHAHAGRVLRDAAQKGATGAVLLWGRLFNATMPPSPGTTEEVPSC